MTYCGSRVGVSFNVMRHLGRSLKFRDQHRKDHFVEGKRMMGARTSDSVSTLVTSFEKMRV